MTPINPKRIPSMPYLMLLTAEKIGTNSQIMAATNGDSQFLYHEPSDRFVGLSSGGILYLGFKQLISSDDDYFIKYDPLSNREYQNVPMLSCKLRGFT